MDTVSSEQWQRLHSMETTYCKKCERYLVNLYTNVSRGFKYKCSNCGNVEIQYREQYAKTNVDFRKFVAYLERTAKAANETIHITVSVSHDKFEHYDIDYDSIKVNKVGYTRYVKKYISEKLFYYVLCEDTSEHLHIQ